MIDIKISLLGLVRALLLAACAAPEEGNNDGTGTDVGGTGLSFLNGAFS